MTAPPYPRLPTLPLLAGSFLAGVTAAAIVDREWVFTALIGALLSMLAWFAFQRRRRPSMLLAAMVVLATFGYARFEASTEALAGVSTAPRGEYEVVGVIRDEPRVRGLYARIDLKVERLDGLEASGAIRVTLPAPLDPLQASERLRMRVELEAPPEIEAFDYPAYLASQGIHAGGAFPESWDRIGHAGGDWRTPLRSLRRELNANIERTLSAPESALAAGVLIGERGTMPQDLTEALRRTGTTHLVIVSGQNVALLLGLGIAVLTLAIPRRRAAITLLLFLPLYVVLVGADPPVVRAAVMAVGIVIASAMGRRTPGWIYLVYAAALMLAWDPLLARNVAFQLSATATAGVIVLAPLLTATTLSRLGWSEAGVRATLIELAATATGATLAVLPVQVAAFERVSLLAIPANVIVAPIYEATVVVAMLAALVGLGEPSASAARPLLSLVPAAFIWVVDVLAALPGGEIPVRAPLTAGALWYVGLVSVTWLFDRRGERPAALDPVRHTSFRWSVGLAVVAFGLWIAALQPAPSEARVTFLDVGHGLAVLIEDGDQRVLFDTGPPDGSLVLALPRGVSGLDAVLISHSDADHAGGLAPLLERLPVSALLADARTIEDLRARLPEAAAAYRFDIGDRIQLTDRTAIEVLSPPTATRGRAHDSDNDGSMVIRITVGDRRILVTADIEAAAETWLVHSGLDLEADVLLIPHQGSKTSSTPAFLEAVGPAAAVLSASATNPYGHPAPEVMARYEGIPVFRTDKQGNVTVTSDGERIWIRTER